MLHGRIVRSPYASARIVRVDTRAARALPGVIAVLTARDVPRNEQRMELPGRMAEATAGAVLATQPVLADDRVRFQGEPVVAIAAATPEIAAAAADLVEIDYEDLPGVYDPLAALAPMRQKFTTAAISSGAGICAPATSPGLRARGRRRREHVSHAVRRSRLHGNRERDRLDRR
jgi:CO/xanthine dehydrogenase Mo-binding subunit